MDQKKEFVSMKQSTDLGISVADISSNLVELLASSQLLKLEAGPIYKKYEKGKCIKISFLYTIVEGKYEGASILIDCPTQNIT